MKKYDKNLGNMSKKMISINSWINISCFFQYPMLSVKSENETSLTTKYASLASFKRSGAALSLNETISFAY